MEPMTLASMMLLLPLASALVILLLHGVLKNTAHIISTMVSTVIWICAVLLLMSGKDVTGIRGPAVPLHQDRRLLHRHQAGFSTTRAAG